MAAPRGEDGSWLRHTLAQTVNFQMSALAMDRRREGEEND